VGFLPPSLEIVLWHFRVILVDHPELSQRLPV